MSWKLYFTIKRKAKITIGKQTGNEIQWLKYLECPNEEKKNQFREGGEITERQKKKTK
jgi:hypothetical protein